MTVFHKNVIHQQCVENVLFDLIWTNLMLGLVTLPGFLHPLVIHVSSIPSD